MRVIRREIVPPAVGVEDREEAMGWLREAIERNTGATPRDVPTLPERHPAILALYVDEAGHLWALRPAGDGATAWDVFDEDGVLLGSVDLDETALLHVAEGAIVGVVRDEYGVDRIRVVPLRR